MFKPEPLNLPPYPFKITQKDGDTYIFDELRKKHLLLTPEEWVRQHFTMYLIKNKRYPKSLIKLEGGFKLNTLQKRSDILIYNLHGEKFLLVECKATSVKITQNTFEQIASYNLIHKVKFLAVTNGLTHYFCEMNYQDKSYKFIPDLPFYQR